MYLYFSLDPEWNDGSSGILCDALSTISGTIFLYVTWTVVRGQENIRLYDKLNAEARTA